MRRSIVVLLTLAACSNEGSGTAQHKPADPPRKLAGVYPERFVCTSITSPEVIGQVLGGTARQLDNPASVPRGIAPPCVYEVMVQPLSEIWTFDFDCRDGMKQRADALFAQYTRTSGELIDQYNIASDAGPGIKLDAGTRTIDAGPEPERRAPEAASEVAVGARGLDHHGQGLLFIDDDAPCYVRVVGPDASRRLALSQLIAKQLTFANAPMTPRPFP